MKKDTVPDIVISRLPWYLQSLNQMAKQGLHTVSSQMLADRLGISAAQIRKDLSFFGGFGKQGKGYPIYALIDQLQRIINIDRVWQSVIVGAGDLGRALAHYQGFALRGIEIVMLFDINPKIVGTQVSFVPVRHVEFLEEEIMRRDIKVAILTVPAGAAQVIADRLVGAGVKAILNYAPAALVLPDHVQVQHIDPVLFLQHMFYYLGDD